MTNIIYFLIHMPWVGYFGLLMFFSAIYFLIIVPPIYYFCVIPRITRRYHIDLTLDDGAYMVAFVNWFIPPMEGSLYIFFKYMGWNKLIRKDVRPDTLTNKLNSVNYDIKQASKVEIVMSCISVFFLVSMVLSAIIFLIFKNQS